MKRMRGVGLIRSAVAVAAMLSLVACGGGGGGDDEVATVSVEGVAAKGILKNAVVTVYRVNADGSETELASSVTNTDGSYSLAGIPAGVVVVVKITAGTSTTMVDEATNTEVAVPVDFQMRAAVVTQEGGTNTVQVTPFSEMAVAKAIAAGSLTAANVEGANADIRTYLGYDVLAERPEFTDDGETPSNKAALMLAAISQLASTPAAVTSLGCNAAAATADRVKCVIDKMAEDGTDDEDLDDLIEDAKEDAIAGETYTGTDVPPPPVTQPVDIVPPTEGASAVAAAKALIDSIRDNAPALGGDGADTLEKRLNAVQTAFDGALNPFNERQQTLVQAIVGATEHLDTVRGAVAADATAALPAFSASIVLNHLNYARGGGCTYYSGDTNTYTEGNKATDYAGVTHIGCRVTHKVILDNGEPYAIQHLIRVAPALGAPGYAVKTQLIKTAGTVATNPDGSQSFTPSNAAPSVLVAFKDASLALARAASGPVTSLALSGRLAMDVGQAGTAVDGYNDVNVQITPNPEGEATRLNLVGLFKARNAAGAELSSLSLKEGSYVQALQAVAGDITSPTVDNSLTEAKFILEAKTGAGHSVSGTMMVGAWATDESFAEAPTQVTFTGRIAGTDGAALFEGSVEGSVSGVDGYNSTLPDSETNSVSKTVELDGTLAVPGRAALAIHLALTEQSHGAYGITGSYEQGSTTVSLSMQGQEGTDTGLSATFSSTSAGVSMTMTPASNVYSITKQGVVIGRFDRQAGVIYYRDNTRETF